MDQSRLIAEVMARTGVRLSPDDPALAMVELNKLAFEDLIERTGERLDPLAERIDKAARLAAAEVSRSILRSIAEETRQARAAIAAEADSARLAAATAIRTIADSHASATRLRFAVVGAAMALALVCGGFAAGFALGLMQNSTEAPQKVPLVRKFPITFRVGNPMTKKLNHPIAACPIRSAYLTFLRAETAIGGTQQ